MIEYEASSWITTESLETHTSMQHLWGKRCRSSGQSSNDDAPRAVKSIDRFIMRCQHISPPNKASVHVIENTT